MINSIFVLKYMLDESIDHIAASWMFMSLWCLYHGHILPWLID